MLINEFYRRILVFDQVLQRPGRADFKGCLEVQKITDPEGSKNGQLSLLQVIFQILKFKKGLNY